MSSPGSNSVKAQWLDAAGDRPCLVVVRRGDEATFSFLQEYAARRSNVRLAWDRRVRKRRVVAQAVLPERRSRDRRRASSESWHTVGFVVAPRSGEDRELPPGGPEPRRAAGARPAGLDPARAPGRLTAVRPNPSRRLAPTRPLTAADREMAEVVVLIEVSGALLPAFYDPGESGWRCPGCEQVMTAIHPGPAPPEPGRHCFTCKGRVVRVLRHRWQRLNWFGLAAVGVGGVVVVRIVGPLITGLL